MVSLLVFCQLTHNAQESCGAHRSIGFHHYTQPVTARADIHPHRRENVLWPVAAQRCAFSLDTLLARLPCNFAPGPSNKKLT